VARARYHDELSALENGDLRWGAIDEFGRSRADILSDYQDRANRLNAISAVYQRADRIITGDSELTVSVVNDPSMQTNAMSNGREIIFNDNLIADVSQDNIMHLHGLNYHEVAHVLFSPRAGSNLIQYVKDNKYRRATYILEEARAEALLVAKYPVTRLFLESATTQYLLDNQDTIGNYFHIITGRTYLPIEVRQAVADEFIAMHGVALAQELHTLIHAYRVLVFPADFDKAKVLIARMAEIVGLDEQQGEIHLPPHGGCEFPVKGRPAKGAEQERLQERNVRMNKDNPTETIGTNPNIGVGGNGTYEGEDVSFDSKDKAISKLLNDRMKAIKENETIKREVNDTRKAILNSDEVRGAVKQVSCSEMNVSESARAIARRFGQELERIVRNGDPKWDKFNARGKLNITRTMNPNVNSIRTMFDQWDTGNPNTDIEAVILTDHSSSMGGLMRSVMENAWIIKRGIEGINGNVTTISFNHESSLIYDKKDKAKPSTYRYLHASGSTNPIRGLIEAERILTMSKRSIKLAFIVTDGEWDMDDDCNAIIKSLNDKGFITCVVFLGGYKYYQELLEQSRLGDEYGESARSTIKRINHGASIFHAVAEPKDVLEVAQSLVKSTLNTNRVA
jgi:hypothetical protein